MRFGIALPNSGPLASATNIDRLAAEAEDLGFDSLLVHDHISYDSEWLGHRTSGLAQPHTEIAPDLYESLTTLAYAAAATGRFAWALRSSYCRCAIREWSHARSSPCKRCRAVGFRSV